MKLFGSLAFGSLCLADISFEGAQDNYVTQIGEDFLVEFDVTFPADEAEELELVVRAEAHGLEKEHKFFKLRSGKEPIHYSLESDVEDVYRDMDDQITATVEDAGAGRVTFSANLTSVIADFDATEFTVEADYGQYSDSTAFLLSTYKLPVIETTLLIDTVNEHLSSNETLRLIECNVLEAGYAPIEQDFFVSEDVSIKIGDLELEHDVNGTTYFAMLTADDIANAHPISSLDGAKASCQFSYSFLDNDYPTEAESMKALEFTYDPTFVTFAPNEQLINKHGKFWGKANDKVTVTCEADGNPKPELKIAVDGVDAVSGAGQDKTSKLTTTHSISGSGEQTVTCEIYGTNSNNAAADALVFDYHYLSKPTLSDSRVNVTRNVFRAGEDSKNSIFCSANSRPDDLNIEYKQNGDVTFDRDGLFTEAANLTITCIATNLLSDESQVSDPMRIQVLPPLVPEEPESGGANIVVIIIVVLLVILLLGAIAFFIIKKRRESESESSAEGYAEGQPKTSDSAGDDV